MSVNPKPAEEITKRLDALQLSSQDGIAAGDSETIEGAVQESAKEDLLSQIFEKLLEMLCKAKEEQWTANLQKAMKHILCPRTQQFRQFSKVAAAEIAVQLAELEKKMPEELKLQLQQLTKDQLREVLKTDWMVEAVKEAVEATKSAGNQDLESEDFLLAAVTAVRLVIYLSIEIPRDDSRFPEMEMRVMNKRQMLRDEAKKNEDEHKKKTMDWISKRAATILKWDSYNNSLVHEKPVVYKSPVAYILKAKAKADAASLSFEVVDTDDAKEEALPMDRVERMYQHLEQPDSTIDDFVKTRHPQQMWTQISKLCGMEMSELDARGEERKDWTESIEELVRGTVEEMPEELQLQLKALKPVQLAKVVLLDWIDQITEEKKNGPPSDEKMSCCSAGVLRTLLSLCFAASMYPEKLRLVVKQSVKKYKEDVDVKVAERLQKLSAEERKNHEDMDKMLSKMKFTVELDKYMPHRKSRAFLTLMFPPPAAYVQSDPSPEYPNWAALIESVDMTEELRAFVTQLQQSEQPQPSLLLDEIAAILHANVYDHTEKQLKKLETYVEGMVQCSFVPPYGESKVELISHISFNTVHMWLDRVLEKEIAENNEQGSEETHPKDYPTVTIAALIFMWAASSHQGSDYLKDRLSELNVRKSADLRESEDSKAFTELCMTAEESTSKKYLFDWINDKSATMLQKGLDLLTPVLMQHMQPTQEKVLQPVQQVITADETEATTERELKIKQQALQLKEETFERVVATFQLKMEELEKKFDDLSKRVEDLEEKNEVEVVESRAVEMEKEAVDEEEDDFVTL